MKPTTADEFMQTPTKQQWAAELENGWAGSDGASWCPDRIRGVRIGQISASYKASRLPAPLHDFRYRQGRAYKLPASWRRLADAELRLGIRKELGKAGVGGFSYAIGFLEAAVIFRVVRIAGWFAWNATAE